MGFADDFNKEILSIEERFSGGLSNTSTKKFDTLISIVAKYLEIDEDKIYITAAASRASNLWNRFAQGKPLTNHFPLALGIINTDEIQGGIAPARKFIGTGNGRYDAIALANRVNGKWVIGAVLDSDALAIYDKVMDAFPGVNITHETIDLSSQAADPIESSDDAETPKKTCLDINLSPRTTKRFALNTIIYGAPGTGKTYSTAEYALAIIHNRDLDQRKKNDDERRKVMDEYNDYIQKGQIVFTTFHQSYGYEEFIQGVRPDPNSDNLRFVPIDGIFKRIADTALIHGETNYVIIIDEINRANISKVFGELITLIENDKRWGEVNQTCATLQSGEIFAVPNNLYIIGTMNSADKSISLIDSALRRRFEFIERSPDATLIDDPTLQQFCSTLNLMLADKLKSSDLLIGHSYFIGRDTNDLCNILNNNIIPLLYEYFYDNRKKVYSILIDVQQATGAPYKIIDNKISRLRAEKADAKNAD